MMHYDNLICTASPHKGLDFALFHKEWFCNFKVMYTHMHLYVYIEVNNHKDMNSLTIKHFFVP